MKEENNQSADDSGLKGRQSPSDQSVVLTREGEALFNDGKIEGAIKAFNKALELDQENTSAMNNLGVLSWHKGNAAGASEYFERALKLDPDNVDAAQNLQEIHESLQNSGELQGPEMTTEPEPSEDSCLQVNIKGGLQICVPRSIKLMTPYILIEQEDWFEDEIHYIRKLLHEGMNVIDIGANYGLYTLTMSKIIGPSGRIWAFEPTSLTAAYLRKSIQTNRMTNIELVQAGLSDKKRFAQISLNTDPEMNAITAEPDSGGKYETVELLSLDECEKTYAWDTIDFIKLDAEGQEHNIILGGKHLLSAQSPLIMFELRQGNSINTSLIRDFTEVGYTIYRLIPGLSILAPIDLTKPFDSYQLNLFCCKADRAQWLQKLGLLTTGLSLPAPISDGSLWQHKLKDLPYFNMLMNSLTPIGQGELLPGWDRYENALNYYVMAHEEDRTADSRYASLHQAWEESSGALAADRTIPRLITHVRIQSELGMREDALHTVNSILNMLDLKKSARLSEPFITASERFGRISPREMGKWLLASILECGEKARAFSSFYTGRSSLDHLELMKTLGYQTPEMERRRQLIRMYYGMQAEPQSNPLLSSRSEDNLNPGLWSTKDASRKPAHTIVSQLGLTLEERIRIVDIGAMDIADGRNPYEVLLTSDLADIIGFEPLEQECRKLNEKGTANRKFLPYAVGDGTIKTFYITNTRMTSSLFEPNHDLTTKFQNLDELMQVIKTEEMQTVRLDDIPEIVNTDFLKLDVQGAEKMILDNAGQMLKNTLVIQTEIEFVPLYKNQPLFADIDKTLREHGFMFHKILGTAGRSFKPLYRKDNINSPISQTLWADVIYVKNFMELDKLSEQKLLKYAVIMHEIFRSWDLCHLVLAEYDRKTGINLSHKYMKLINNF